MVGDIKSSGMLPLREDLHLYDSISDDNGAPTWVIFDQSSGTFYKIGVIEFEMLSRWHLMDKDKILMSCYKETPFFPSPDDFEELLEFLKEKNLLIPDEDESENLYVKSLSQKESLVNKLLKNYLFFRMPFAHPNAILKFLEPIADKVYNPQFFKILMGLFVFNLILFFQNLDTVMAHVKNPLNSINFIYVGVALILAKFTHEFGHILACVKNKVKIPSIGLAFIVMMPMLYVDTSESWKISDAKKRLAVSSAGISFELILALICFPLYLLVNNEALKMVLLYISITSVSISLFLNASPFMRFDGYFILQDILKEENLHDKAFGAFKSKLRYFLFGIKPQEVGKKENYYAIFGLLTGIYRLVLYFGIAVAVYYMFIKIVGIVMFLIELYFFVLMPFIKEFKYIQKVYPLLEKENKKSFWIKVSVIFGLIFISQFSNTVGTIGYVSPKEYREIYAPFPGQVKFRIQEGIVKKDDLLLSIENFQLALKQQSSSNSLKYAKDYYNRISVSEKELETLKVAKNQVNVSSSVHQLNNSRSSKLEIVADFDGIVSDFSDSVEIGSFVSKDELLAVYYNKKAWVIHAYVNEEQLSKVEVGNSVSFYPTSMLGKINGKVVYVHKNPILYLPNMLLIDKNNHDFEVESVRSDSRIKNGVKTKSPLYQIDVDVSEDVDFNQIKKGHVVIKTGIFYNLFNKIKYVLSIVIKEFNFF